MEVGVTSLEPRDDEDEAGENAIQRCLARCKAGGERHPHQSADETASQIFRGHRPVDQTGYSIADGGGQAEGANRQQ